MTWDDDGHLRPDNNPRHWMRQRYDGVIIDTLTGAVTHTDDQRELWNVVQRGDPRENDYVLIQQQTAPQVPSDQTKARAATEFIRIRAWSEKPMPTVRLLAFHWGDFASGPCEVVR